MASLTQWFGFEQTMGDNGGDRAALHAGVRGGKGLDMI